MSVEGSVRVVARFDGTRLSAVRVGCERPLVAQRLLAGKTPAEALQLIPNLYSVCGRSQAVVAAAALDAALGDSPGPAVQRRRERELAAEALAEHAFRLLLDWPKLTGAAGDVALLTRIRSLLSSAPVSEASWGAARDALAGMAEARLLAAELDPWLEQFSASEWLDWARAGRTDCGRTLAALASLPAWAAPETQALTRPTHSAFAERIARPALADPAFAARPVLDGGPAECGPLARCLSQPAVRDLARRDRITARAFSRMAEFALILREDSATGRLESASLGPGEGAAVGEMARGLLVHAARLEGGRIADYAIVAPTEWNFHPQGALHRELEGRPVRNAGEARRALSFAAATLDPCVALDARLETAEAVHA
jgi:coenzyme F420-reducing hydrogenase alpha subunit